MDILPRHVICILGRWSDFGEVREVVAACGEDFTLDDEYSQLSPDDRMSIAFEASVDRFRPTMTDDDWKSIREHTAVAYILSPPMQADAAESISARALLLTATLLNQGGLAAKSESAGLAHGRSRWIELGRSYLAAKTSREMLIPRPRLFIGLGSSGSFTIRIRRCTIRVECTCSDIATPRSKIRCRHPMRWNGLTCLVCTWSPTSRFGRSTMATWAISTCRRCVWHG